MQTSTLPNNAIRPKGIIVVAMLMILFGAAEIVTGFTHDSFGLTTAQVNPENALRPVSRARPLHLLGERDPVPRPTRV